MKQLKGAHYLFLPLLLVLCLSVLCTSVFSVPAYAAKSKSSGSAENPKYASIVMDADTGMILHQRNADKPLHPASLTKVMTLLLVFEAIEQGKTNLNDRVYISKYAAAMAPSKLGLSAGSNITVKNAIFALVTKSANDIAVALAEHVGGTESNFAQMMTRRAQLMGMNNTVFRNASGLHDPRQLSSARDMAKLARAVIVNYPEYYKYFGTQNFAYNGHNYHNHNRLLGKYPGMDGMKTGYVNASGFNLVASAVRNNRRIIGVVFGGRSTQSRNDHMVKLLDDGFARLKDTTIRTADASAPGASPMDSSMNSSAVMEDMMEAAPVAPVERSASSPIPAQKPVMTAFAMPDSQVGTQRPTSPGQLRTLQLASLNAEDFGGPDIQINTKDALPAAGNAPPTASSWAALNSALESEDKISEEKVAVAEEKVPEEAGQGDFDPAVSRRIETGLIAVAALKKENPGQYQKVAFAPSTIQAPSSSAYDEKAWSIQVGAFSSRAKTDQVLHSTLKSLPAQYASATPVIAPLKTDTGWIFRARLSGYTQAQAQAACRHLKGCMAVAPRLN